MTASTADTDSEYLIEIKTTQSVNLKSLFSVLKDQITEANISITRQLRADLAVGINYRFEPYRVSDYYTNNLVPYGVTQVAGGTFGSNTPRQLFLDARFTSMHANVATVFLRYSF